MSDRLCAKVAWMVLLVVAGGVAHLRAQSPSLEGEGERFLAITNLPGVLEEESVAPHLTRGLTTTFLFVVDLLEVSNGKRAGACRVEIRYELWDEVFHTTVLSVDGRLQSEEIGSHEELLEWWSRLRLIAVDRLSLQSPPRAQARVKLEIAPFSRGEERDTQEWFADSMSTAEAVRNQGISASVDGSEKRESSVFSVLIATSIRRRPLTTFAWTVDMTSGEPR